MPADRRNNFRFEGKFVFLTYAQCNLTPEQVLEALQEVKVIKHYNIARETHEDGNYHIHAVIEFDEQLRTRRADVFDIQGFHPNIQKPRSLRACLQYVRKEGEFINNFPTGKKTWGDILADSQTRDDFLSGVRQHYPRDYILCYDRVISFADAHFRPVVPPYVNQYEFNNVPAELTAWVEENITAKPGKGSMPDLEPATRGSAFF